MEVDGLEGFEEQRLGVLGESLLELLAQRGPLSIDFIAKYLPYDRSSADPRVALGRLVTQRLITNEGGLYRVVNDTHERGA